MLIQEINPNDLPRLKPPVQTPTPRPTTSATQPFYITRWLPLLYHPHQYRILNLTPFEIRMLRLITSIGSITRDISEPCWDTIRDSGLPIRITRAIRDLGGSIHIRFDPCAPKDGVMGNSNMTNARDVIRQICTSSRTLDAVEAMEAEAKVEGGELKCPLVMLAFDEEMMDQARLFRCFVFRNRLTGVSQLAMRYTHDWTHVSTQIWGHAEWLAGRIGLFNEYKIKDEWSERLNEDGFTFDIVVKGEDLPKEVEDVRLVQVGAFGKESGVDPALFGWIRDREKLMGKSGKVPEMRIVGRPYPRVRRNAMF